MTFDAFIITPTGPQRVAEVLQFDHVTRQVLVITDDVELHWVHLNRPKLVQR